MTQGKTCFRCGIEKPHADFYAHPGMRDGLLGKCKQCTKDDATQHRNQNLERYRAYDRARASLPHRREKNISVNTAWKAEYPKRRLAQVTLGNAVRDKRVIPWPVCAIHTCDRRPVAHHPDYDRPLDVVWLCQPHHKQAHAVARP